MTDVVPDNIAYKKHCQADAYNGEDKVEPVGSGGGETVCEQMLNGMDNPLQRPSSQSSKDAHHKTDEQHETFFVYLLSMASTPFQEACGNIAQEGVFVCGNHPCYGVLMYSKLSYYLHATILSQLDDSAWRAWDVVTSAEGAYIIHL